MIRRRSRPALLAILLACLAVLGMSALAGWHSATFHEDSAAHMVLLEHGQAGDSRDDGNSPVHVAAHHVTHAIASRDGVMRFVPPRAIAAAWRIVTAAVAAGFDPPSLLRPPRP